MIIGLDILNKINVERSQKNQRINKISVDGYNLKVFSEYSDKILCSFNEIIIPPKSQKTVHFNSPGISKNGVFTLVPHPNRPNFVTVRSTICDGSKLIGCIENHSEGSISVPAEVPLYEIIEADPEINNLMVIDDPKSEAERYERFLTERKIKFKADKLIPKVDLGDSIKNDPQKVSEIREILEKYNLAFSSEKMDIGLIQGFRYKVDLRDGAEAWYQPPRRIPPAIKPELTQQFKMSLIMVS